MENKIEEFKKFVLEQLIDYDEFREAPPEGYVDDITDKAVKLFAIPVVIESVCLKCKVKMIYNGLLNKHFCPNCKTTVRHTVL